MAFRRFRRRRLLRRGRKFGRSWGSQGARFGRSVGSLAWRAYRGVRYLKGLVNAELYKYDVSDARNIGNDGADVFNMTGMAQGDGDSDRTGLSCFIRSVYIRAQFVIAAAANETNIRMILVRDSQQIADTVPPLSAVLEALTMVAPLNNTTVGRFTILKDRTFSMSQNGNQTMVRQFWVPMKHHVRFNGTGASDIQKGGLYLYFLSDQPTNEPGLILYTRTSYHDN